MYQIESPRNSNLEIIEFQARLNQTARALNILLAIIRFTNKRKSLKPRRALAGIEFSFQERGEGMVRRDEQPVEDSFEFSFTGDHSRGSDGEFHRSFTSSPTSCSPILSRFIRYSPIFLEMKFSLFAPLFVPGFRGRPTDSRFSEKRRKRADSNSANNIIIHFHRGLVIILTMDRD